MKRSTPLYLSMALLVIISSCQTEQKAESEKEPEVKTEKPNILLIVADDMGYTDIGPFGAEIATPTLDGLAEEGVLLTNFHVLPTCSPSRSVLLSGVDNHIAGLGAMAELTSPRQKGKPGYEGYLNNTVAHMPRILNDAGYHTYMVGKWHLGEEEEHRPSLKGFEQTFVLLNGGGSHWADQLGGTPTLPMTYARNGEVLDSLPKDFYSTRNYTDQLLEWLEKDKDDDKPFFAYVAYTAPHDPLHAPQEYIDKYKGKYDAGFNALRSARYERLKSLGILPDSIQMHPGNAPEWDQLSEEEQAIAARDMEVYAAMIDYMDEQIARIIDRLESLGKLDNTLVVFMSDNGANGATLDRYPGQTEEYMSSFDNSLENRGLPNSLTDVGPNWASASMGPYRLFKGFTSEGGIIAPCIVKLPEGIKKDGNTVNAFAHISDLMPTFLELAGATHPSMEDDAVPTLMGSSLIPLFTGRQSAIHANEGIGYELHGMRAYIKNEWKILNLPVPFGNGDWQLYNMAHDPSEINDMSAEFPEKRNELISAYEEYSENVGMVYEPLN